MCGISGVYAHSLSAPSKENVLKKMIAIQHHRGPDSNGIFVDETVGLAHNRLSLLDLSANGHQPFEDAQHALIFNGEIYNFQEVRKLLPARNYVSTSDTEVLFWALKTKGVDATLQMITGMFAFAWYDKTEKTLALCRDRLGIKPLFYGKSKDGVFCFASELKTLVHTFDFEPDPLKILYSSMGILEKSRDYTAFKNLYLVPPGAYLTVNQNEIKLHPYFDLLDLIDEKEYNRLNKAPKETVFEEFNALLKESVKSMLVSDAPMGCFVSGGIDSSLIAHHASEMRGEVKLFTANVVGKHSEIKDAQILSKALNKKLYEYAFEKEYAIRDVTKVTYHYDAPVITHFNAIPFSNVAALTRTENVKAVLTGEGADELFLGYPKLLTKRYNSLINSPISLINFVYSKIPGLSSYTSSSSGSEGLLGLFEQGSQNFGRQYLREEGLKKYEFLKGQEREDVYLSIQMLKEGIVSLLWRNDRMGMIHSIESRFPFLDESILKFAINLPLKYKIGRTPHFYNYKHPFLIDKMIVRKVAEEKLPKSLVYKQKNGFPTHGWRDIVVAKQFFDKSIVSDYMGISGKGLDYFLRNSSNYHVSLLASTELWSKLFIDKKSVMEVENDVKSNFSFK